MQHLRNSIILRFLRPLLRVTSLVLCCGFLVLSHQAARAEIGSIGDINAAIDPLGYGITGQPGSIGGDLIIGQTDLGGVFIDVAFDPGPLINSGDGILGRDFGSYGAVSIDGFPSDWLIGGNLTIGDAGTGNVDLFDSAKVQVGDATYNTGSVPRSSAIPTVVAGTGLTTIGAQESGLGSLKLEAIASRLVTADFIVGDYGVGNVQALSRSAIYSANAYLGNGDGSAGTVLISDLGTRWSVGNLDLTTPTPAILTIGNEPGVSPAVGLASADPQLGTGQGTLQIAEQGLVEVSDSVAINPAGRVELSTGGRLRILPSAAPTSTSGDAIVNNGVVMGDGFVDFTTSPSSSTPLTFHNGITGEIRNQGNYVTPDFATLQRETLIFSGDLLTNDGLIESTGGEMEFNAFVDNNGDILARDAILRFDGGITNSGEMALGGETTLYGDITTNDNLIFLPDSSVVFRGTFTIDPAALVAFTVGSMASTLDVIGDTIINGGFLRLHYSNGGIASQPGDSYQLLTASDGITGTFDNGLSRAVSDDGRLWDIIYSANSISVTATALLAVPIGADFNGDGIVDALDLDIWRTYYGSTGAPGSLDELGDADGDGDVDGADFLRLQGDYGGPPTPLLAAINAAATAVPEPATLVLVGWLAVGSLCRGKRRK